MATRENARDAIVSQARKAGNASRHQIHVYIGANDYFYGQLRRAPVAMPGVSTVPRKIGRLADDGVEPLRRAIRSARPAKLRETVVETIQEQVDTVRGRREEFANRGETIAADWTSALAVQDANSLIETVRGADGAGELAKSLRTWFAEFPPADTTTRSATVTRKPTAGKTARKTTARKTTARKRATVRTAARKTARKVAATRPATSE